MRSLIAKRAPKIDHYRHLSGLEQPRTKLTGELYSCPWETWWAGFKYRAV